MNLESFTAPQPDDIGRIREALSAMPFLAASRVVIVSDAQTLKTAMRRELWAVAQAVPEGSILVIADLLSPKAKKPEPLGSMAGRSALRVDTTANEETRARFVQETLRELGVAAEPRVIGELARSTADLSAVRSDLQKLALAGGTITFDALRQESLSIEDPKAYQFAGALIEGRTADALAVAQEMFANDRGAAVPLIYALATECGIVWEVARGGDVPARHRWRERFIRPLAKRIGEQRARRAYERCIGAFEAVVSGRSDDPQLAVEMLAAELRTLGQR